MKLKLNRDGRSYVHKYGQKTNVNAFKLPNPNVELQINIYILYTQISLMVLRFKQNNSKNNANKIFIKIKKYYGYNFKYNILYKRIFSLKLFCFNHNLKNDDDVFLILNINRGPQVAYSRINLLNGEERV